jgi:hypothetical protein
MRAAATGMRGRWERVEVVTGMSTAAAVGLCLLAASLWGSWAASLKHIGAHPLDGFVLTLYASAFCFVWLVALTVGRQSLLGSIGAAWSHDPMRLLGILGGGAAFAIGMSLTLTVMRSLGLTVAQPIQSSTSIILGTVWTVTIGGVPRGVPISRLVAAIAVLVTAVLFTMLAAWLRSRAWRALPNSAATHTASDFARLLPVVLMASLLASAYPWALAIGLRSPTQPHGLGVLPYMALLVTGSFAGILTLCGLRLARAGELRNALQAPFRIKRWGLGSGIFHFGGNIIHSVGAASLTASVAYPLGLTASFWTQLWGLVHGEFRGASRLAQLSLGIGMAMYCLGVGLIITTL